MKRNTQSFILYGLIAILLLHTPLIKSEELNTGPELAAPVNLYHQAMKSLKNRDSLQWDTITLLLLISDDLNKEISEQISRHHQVVFSDFMSKSPQSDQQTGASSGASSGTSLVDKTSFSEILNLAIEYGAVTKTNSGANFTLQTTPYTILTKLGTEDTPETWDKYAMLRKISVAATFNNGDETEDSGLRNFERAEIKLALLGAKNPRDKSFRNKVQEKYDEKFQQLSLSELAGNVEYLYQQYPDIREFSVYLQTEWEKNIIDRSKSSDKMIWDELNLIKNEYMKTKSFVSVASKKAVLEILLNMETYRKITKELNKETDKELKEYTHSGSQCSFVYGFDRDPDVSDYSRMKLLYSYQSGPLTANINAEADYNHYNETPLGSKLKDLRSYSAEIGITIGKFPKDQEICDFTFAGKFIREENKEEDIAQLQAKTNLYFSSGLSIPLALTYSSKSEDSDTSHVSFDFGLSFDVSALTLGKK